MSDTTTSPEAMQLALETELAKMIDALATPELKASTLIKAGFFRDELRKMAPMMRDLDEEMQSEVMNEWFAGGDSDIKRLVFNVMAGTEEIPLTKRAEPGVGEAALAKMVEEAPDDQTRGHLLIKMGKYRTEAQAGLLAIADKPAEERDVLIKSWIETGGDSDLKKNILDAEMTSDAKRIYGTGVQADQVVTQTAGNASSAVGRQLGGSETNSDTRIARTIPRAPTGAGAGNRMGNAVMPAGKGGESPNPGSGPNDGGGGEVRPTTLIRRTTTTGGLGNVAGGDTPDKTVKNGDGKTDPKRKKAWKKGEKDWDDAKKIELAQDLVKHAPEPMVAAMTELDEDTQVAVAQIASVHGADLIAFSGMIDPTKLAKRDLDTQIAAWLTADPNLLDLKKWVAEALMTAEEIPMDLGKAIMEWKPSVAARQAA